MRMTAEICRANMVTGSRTRFEAMADRLQDDEHGASRLGRILLPVRHLARDLLQPGNCLTDLRFAEHAFFHQKMDKAFAEHQCSLTLGITGTHSHARKDL